MTAISKVQEMKGSIKLGEQWQNGHMIDTPISKTIIMAMTKGAITVFAPTDEAMARLDEETRAKVREMPSLFRPVASPWYQKYTPQRVALGGVYFHNVLQMIEYCYAILIKQKDIYFSFPEGPAASPSSTPTFSSTPSAPVPSRLLGLKGKPHKKHSGAIQVVRFHK